MRNAVPIAFLLLAGCGTHLELKRNTTNTAGTVMDIQYQMVLDNFARMVRSPASLPSHIRIKQGTVQVSDEWGIYQLRVSGVASGTFGGPRAQRTISEQWGADAITDPRTLIRLQDLYRTAMQLAPLPKPSFLGEGQAQGDGHRPASGGPKPKANDRATEIDLQRDVPNGWLHVGQRSQVPGDALYVGHSDETWVWALPSDAADLSRFTLLVLLVTKLGPGESVDASGGLMYTGGGG